MAATAALIAGAAAAIGSYLSSSGGGMSSSQKHAAKMAQTVLKPAKVVKQATALLPEFRSLIAAGAGPQMQQGVNAAMAQGGLFDTGYGAILTAAANAAPGLAAMQMAWNEAFRLAQARSNAFLGAGSQMPPEQPNPLGRALLAGVGAGATAYRGAAQPAPGTPKTTTTDLEENLRVPRGFVGPPA